MSSDLFTGLGILKPPNLPITAQCYQKTVREPQHLYKLVYTGRSKENLTPAVNGLVFEHFEQYVSFYF